MLDSTAVPLPRPLKRSASVASLPTPPRTMHKRKHTSRSVYDSDQSEDDDAVQKKRRTSSAQADEDAFWTKPDGDAGTKSDGDAPEPKPLPSGLVYRRLAPSASTSSVGSAPVSPPPSNRKATVVKPITPKQQRIFPMRDSPNNPFLVSPSAASVADDSASPSPSPRTPVAEQPTVTYVFRGVRGTFPNPLWDHERGRPRSPSSRSRLPVEHPDYSPDPHCPPKLLFPSAPKKPLRKHRSAVHRETKERQKTLEEEMQRGGTGKKKRARSNSVDVSGSDSEGEGEEPRKRIRPMKLDFVAQLGGR